MPKRKATMAPKVPGPYSEISRLAPKMHAARQRGDIDETRRLAHEIRREYKFGSEAATAPRGEPDPTYDDTRRR